MHFHQVQKSLHVDDGAELQISVHVDSFPSATDNVDLPGYVLRVNARVRSSCPLIRFPLFEWLPYQGFPKDILPTQIATWIRCM